MGRPVDRNSSPEGKISLFRSLFRGREDVFARRFESPKTGRSGYSPVCANEWLVGVCEKPRVKCARCRHRALVPVTDDTIRAHLVGRDSDGKPFVMGLYPMLLDETCFLLAVDLDGDGWQDDAKALARTCNQHELPGCLEVSRSGDGAHLWLFFSEAVPAVLARKLGTHLLTEAMEHHPDLGFASYDRLFPNQDTLPRGGFGNLIALPLQGLARASGNSVFVDGSLNPYADQWEFLATVRRLTLAEVRSICHSATERGRVIGIRAVPEEDHYREPWTLTPSRQSTQPLLGPLPEQITAVLSDQIYLPRADMSPSLRNHLLRLAAFQNPEFYRSQAMRLPTYDKPRIIACAEEYEEHIALPRGCLSDLKSFLRTHGIRLKVQDKRNRGAPTDFSFQGTLRKDQQEAMEALLSHDIGVLAATTAFGKTVLASAMIVERGVNTLVLVHRRQLMSQWIERLTQFLGLERKQIGALGGGRRKLKGTLDIALMQSLVRGDVVDDRIAEYGHIIVDECHHVSARSFELALRRAKAKYVLGLSATVTRKDGHHPIIFMQCGPVRHQVLAQNHAGTKRLRKQVIVRPTRFRGNISNDQIDAREDFTRLMDMLVHDCRRNAAIVADIETAVIAGCFPLVLTERTEHLVLLSDLLSECNVEPICIRGGMGKRELQDELAKIDCAASGKGQYAVLATGRFVGEGFDVPQFDALFIALPVSWKGTVAQYVGRLHRLQEGKDLVRVFDYADLSVPVLTRMFDRRCKAYRQQGYSIMLPASALPGWPPEVPLPIEEKWKQTYSASVQRLVRDGVDIPLAELFVEVTTIERVDDREDVDRARSASEAFLFTRLEGLPETEGRFILNTRLNIPFRGHGTMEVDFLDEENRLAIELDGAHHFDDLDAYRRDREKDYLLQEHGFCVIRFLAEDLGTHLNHVLDTILRALAHSSKT